MIDRDSVEEKNEARISLENPAFQPMLADLVESINETIQSMIGYGVDAAGVNLKIEIKKNMYGDGRTYIRFDHKATSKIQKKRERKGAKNGLMLIQDEDGEVGLVQLQIEV